MDFALAIPEWDREELFGGWQVSGIMVLQSGMPFTVYTSAPFTPIITNGDVHRAAAWHGDYNADGYNYDVPNARPPEL